jgi:hypothetical protein
MQSALTLSALASALGLGLLIGVVRERSHPDPQHAVAGVRTHTIIAIAGALGAALGTIVLVAVLLTVGALAQPGLAAGLSVIVAAALWAKAPLHRLARERISEQELTDALLLAGAALIVLPLLLAGVLAAASPELAAGVAMPLASGAAVLVLFAVVLPLGGGGSQALPEGAQPRAFNLVHALLLA